MEKDNNVIITVDRTKDPQNNQAVYIMGRSNNVKRTVNTITRLITCKFFKTQTCGNGNTCRFLHTETPLTTNLPELNSDPNVSHQNNQVPIQQRLLSLAGPSYQHQQQSPAQSPTDLAATNPKNLNQTRPVTNPGHQVA